MPNRKQIRRFGSAVIAAALTLAASSPVASANHLYPDNSGSGSGSAAVDCGGGPVRQAFSAFNDPNWYYLLPGGDFESGLGWSISGWAGVVPFSSTLGLTGVIGDNSLAMGRYSQVISPPFCVTSDRPHVRLAALAPGNRDGELEITVRLRDPDGSVTDRSERELQADDHRSWRPSRYIYLRTDELRPGETAMVDLRIRSRGDWLIDEVFIDPYRRG